MKRAKPEQDCVGAKPPPEAKPEEASGQSLLPERPPAGGALKPQSWHSPAAPCWWGGRAGLAAVKRVHCRNLRQCSNCTAAFCGSLRQYKEITASTGGPNARGPQYRGPQYWGPQYRGAASTGGPGLKNPPGLRVRPGVCLFFRLTYTPGLYARDSTSDRRRQLVCRFELYKIWNSRAMSAQGSRLLELPLDLPI